MTEQVLLSKEDLKMIMDEVSDEGVDSPHDCSAVNLKTFLSIMENTSW